MATWYWVETDDCLYRYSWKERLQNGKLLVIGSEIMPQLTTAMRFIWSSVQGPGPVLTDNEAFFQLA